MSTGQTILTIGAFVLLTTILQGLYNSLGNVGSDIDSGQDGILQTAVATSYTEYAYGLAFDEVTANSDTAYHSIAPLTYPCGPEVGEATFDDFNDIDDLNGFVNEKFSGGSGRKFKTSFIVSYVDSNNVNTIVNARTYIKRLDLKTWRTFPPPLWGEMIDTLKTSVVMGYFHFD